ncbi:MAG: zinc-finger domain-containing protein [Acidocella sp.]|nr:zinc-finger domain-containing protein [Acidocella sp.]
MDGTMKSPTEIIHVKTRAVSCDGGAEPLGHPKVYLRIETGQITCPYCSKVFILETGAPPAGH